MTNTNDKDTDTVPETPNICYIFEILMTHSFQIWWWYRHPRHPVHTGHPFSVIESTLEGRVYHRFRDFLDMNCLGLIYHTQRDSGNLDAQNSQRNLWLWYNFSSLEGRLTLTLTLTLMKFWYLRRTIFFSSAKRDHFTGSISKLKTEKSQVF